MMIPGPMPCPDLITGIVCEAIKQRLAQQTPSLEFFNLLTLSVLVVFILFTVLIWAVSYAVVLRSEMKLITKKARRGGLPVILEVVEEPMEKNLKVEGKKDSEYDLAKNDVML